MGIDFVEGAATNPLNLQSQWQSFLSVAETGGFSSSEVQTKEFLILEDSSTDEGRITVLKIGRQVQIYKQFEPKTQRFWHQGFGKLKSQPDHPAVRIRVEEPLPQSQTSDWFLVLVIIK